MTSRRSILAAALFAPLARLLKSATAIAKAPPTPDVTITCHGWARGPHFIPVSRVGINGWREHFVDATDGITDFA